MSAVPKPTVDQAVARVLEDVSELAVLPQVVFKVMELTGGGEGSAAKLEDAIVVDPGFSARIIRQANSAYYALPKKVNSIREAVMFVGFSAVRDMAMTIGVFDLFLGKNDKASLRRRTWWRQSLNAATCGRDLAAFLKVDSPDLAYTAGLLHLIGKSLLERCDPRSYVKVEVLEQNGALDHMAERAVFGCSHLDVTWAAAGMWKFPQDLRAGLWYADPTNRPEGDPKLGAITAISHLAAQHARAEDPRRLPNPPAWVFESLNIDQSHADHLLGIGRKAIEKAQQLADTA